MVTGVTSREVNSNVLLNHSEEVMDRPLPSSATAPSSRGPPDKVVDLLAIVEAGGCYLSCSVVAELGRPPSSFPFGCDARPCQSEPWWSSPRWHESPCRRSLFHCFQWCPPSSSRLSSRLSECDAFEFPGDESRPCSASPRAAITWRSSCAIARWCSI